MSMTDLFRLGRDAEVRYTPNGDPVANLSLAYNYGRKGEDGKQPSQWIDASLWGKLAEALSEYLKKGTQVYASIDDVHIEEFTDRDGAKRSKLAGRINAIKLAGGRREEGAAPAPSPAPKRHGDRAGAPPQAKSAPTGTGFDDMDDDIPF